MEIGTALLPILALLLIAGGIALWLCKIGKDTYEPDEDGEKVNLVCHILASQPFRRLYAIGLIGIGLFITLQL